MRTNTLIQMRGTLAEIIPRLPESLAFLIPALRDDTHGNKPLAKAMVELGPSELADLVCFGRQRLADRTILRIARLYERYDRADLGDSPMAELYLDPELYRDMEGEPPEVENATSAFRGRWDCSRCDRVRLEQVGPLKVRPVPGLDVQLTDLRQLLLARHLAAVAEQAGAEVRGLSGPGDFVQVVTPDVVALRPEFPLVRVSEPCPACGRAVYNRDDFVEGRLSIDGGEDSLVVAKEWPLSAEVTEVPASRNRDVLGYPGYVGSEGRHAVGAVFDLERNRWVGWAAGWCYVVFLHLSLVDALLSHGATGLSLRPVHWMAPGSLSDPR